MNRNHGGKRYLVEPPSAGAGGSLYNATSHELRRIHPRADAGGFQVAGLIFHEYKLYS